MQNTNYPPLINLIIFDVSACPLKKCKKQSSFPAFFVNAHLWAYCPDNKNSSCNFQKKTHLQMSWNIWITHQHTHTHLDFRERALSNRHCWPADHPLLTTWCPFRKLIGGLLAALAQWAKLGTQLFNLWPNWSNNKPKIVLGAVLGRLGASWSCLGSGGHLGPK